MLHTPFSAQAIQMNRQDMALFFFLLALRAGPVLAGEVCSVAVLARTRHHFHSNMGVREADVWFAGIS